MSYLAFRLHLLNRLLARPAADRRYITNIQHYVDTRLSVAERLIGAGC